MKIEDLFPPCAREECKEKEGHRHILPMQQALLDSKERYVALVGGYGSGKTLPTCIMGHLLSVSIPGNMGIVLRRSLPKMHDSTERIYIEVLQRSGVQFQAREMRDGWPHRIIYGNGSEVYFRETKDLGRFLGPEYGWFFIDEAQEEPEKTFKDLMGRLRLSRTSRYLRGIIATNPPSNQHWIAKTFPQPGSWIKEVRLKDGSLVKTTWRMLQSSTYDNPFLAPDYIAGLLLNHSPAEIKRIVEGHYGFVTEGDPVYPTFDFFKHVGDPVHRVMTLYRVWDFGFHCPAVLWSQMFRCAKNQLHLVCHDEYVGTNIEAEPLAAVIIPQTALSFPNIPSQLVIDGGDAAGAAVSDKGPGPIIRLARLSSEGGHNLRFRYRKFSDIDPGLDLVRKLLRTKCQCGYYLFMAHRRCRLLIEALSGGYHYPKEKPGYEKGRKPVKDGFFDNIADTLRYTVELFYRARETDQDFDVDSSMPIGESHPWDWMGA